MGDFRTARPPARRKMSSRMGTCQGPRLLAGGDFARRARAPWEEKGDEIGEVAESYR
jgi:hypothetical protein